MSPTILTFIFAAGFVLLHLFSKNMKFLSDTPRSRILSVAGGIAVAYVFLHLLPDLAEYEEDLKGTLHYATNRFFEHHLYMIAMFGLAVFYGLEQMANASKRHNLEDGRHKARPLVFWIHIGSFTLYNALIGYLLVREQFTSHYGRLFFFIAMGVHFITNDRGLRATHKEDYDRYGRWLLAVAILAGWPIGTLTEVSDVLISYLTALLAGGVIMNVMKEELPEERESSFTAFFLGLIAYSLILILL